MLFWLFSFRYNSYLFLSSSSFIFNLNNNFLVLINFIKKLLAFNLNNLLCVFVFLDLFALVRYSFPYNFIVDIEVSQKLITWVGTFLILMQYKDFISFHNQRAVWVDTFWAIFGSQYRNQLTFIVQGVELPFLGQFNLFINALSYIEMP